MLRRRLTSSPWHLTIECAALHRHGPTDALGTGLEKPHGDADDRHPFDPVRRIEGSTCLSPPMGESPFESGARYLPLIEELP